MIAWLTEAMTIDVIVGMLIGAGVIFAALLLGSMLQGLEAVFEGDDEPCDGDKCYDCQCRMRDVD